MKKKDFQEITQTLKSGDSIILQIRALVFMPARAAAPPLAHCFYLSSDSDFISVSYEGTVSEGGILSNGDKLPNRVNYARIEKIEKL